MSSLEACSGCGKRIFVGDKPPLCRILIEKERHIAICPTPDACWKDCAIYFLPPALADTNDILFMQIDPEGNPESTD